MTLSTISDVDLPSAGRVFGVASAMTEDTTVACAPVPAAVGFCASASLSVHPLPSPNFL